MMVSSSFNQMPSRLSFSSFWVARQKAASSGGETHLPEVPEHLAGEEKRIQTLGVFFHELIEKIAKRLVEGGDFQSVVRGSFRGLLADYQQAFPEVDFRSEPKINEIYETVRHQWEQIAGPYGERHYEIEIQSKDELLFGVPDLVTETEVGICLRDFKLVSNPSNLITEKNEAQLSFYSYLVEECYGVFPVEVCLIGLRGASAELSIDRTYAHSIADEAKTMLRQLQSDSRSAAMDVSPAINGST